MSEPPRDVTTEGWQSAVLKSSRLVAVAFWHEQCAWSKRLDSDFAAVAAERSSKMAFYKTHVFREPEIARRYGVMSTPTIKFFCAGREIHEIVGYRAKAALLKEVDAVLANSDDCLRFSTPIDGT